MASRECEMKLKTHLKIDNSLSGKVICLEENYAKVVLKTTNIMSVDDEGLVHGGFCFCAADFAAMAAVNDPFVVLAKSDVKFLSPLKSGESVEFEAKVIKNDGRKQSVEVCGKSGEKEVFYGLFYTVILKKHVLL